MPNLQHLNLENARAIRHRPGLELPQVKTAYVGPVRSKREVRKLLPNAEIYFADIVTLRDNPYT